MNVFDDKGERLCLVLDIDDTLYLERDYVRSGFRAVGEWCERHIHMRGFYAQAWKLFKAGHRGDIFDRTLATLGTEPHPSLISELVSVYREHKPDIRLLPDTIDFLNCFQGIAAFAIVSDGPLCAQSNKIEALRLAQIADVIALTARWGVNFSKPHKRAFQYVQRNMGGQGQFVYIADNPAKDFTAPHRLGWRTVRVRRPEGLHYTAESNSGEVDVEVSSLGALIGASASGAH